VFRLRFLKEHCQRVQVVEHDSDAALVTYLLTRRGPSPSTSATQHLGDAWWKMVGGLSSRHASHPLDEFNFARHANELVFANEARDDFTFAKVEKIRRER